MALLEVAKAFRGRDRSDGKKLGHQRCVLEWGTLASCFFFFSSLPSGQQDLRVYHGVCVTRMECLIALLKATKAGDHGLKSLDTVRQSTPLHLYDFSQEFLTMPAN